MGDDQSIGVIYVEDDNDVRIGGVQALELAGFSVSGFASVETASGVRSLRHAIRRGLRRASARQERP